jgi:hypothetical protein
MVEEKLRDGLDSDKTARTDGPEELHRSGVSGNEDVLPVVDDCPCRLVDKRIGASPGGFALLEEKDGDPAGGETDGGGKPAEAPADDDNRVHSVWGLGLPGCHERPSQEYFSVLLSQYLNAMRTFRRPGTEMRRSKTL